MGSTSGRGTVQTVGWRAPSQRISAGAGQRGIAEGVGVDAEGVSRLGRIEPAAVEVGVELRREVFGPASGAAGIRQPAKRERCVVARRDDVGRVAQAPDLDERRIVPRIGRGTSHAGVERMERGARDAVLETGRGGSCERGRRRREALVEGAGPPPEREDLRARDVEPRRRRASGYGRGNDGSSRIDARSSSVCAISRKRSSMVTASCTRASASFRRPSRAKAQARL